METENYKELRKERRRRRLSEIEFDTELST